MTDFPQDTTVFELATELGGVLHRLGWRVSTAESCTGGAIAAAITAVAGSSAWFDYGLVTYANEAKRQLLGVDGAVLESEGAVSEVVARQMVDGALRVSGADVAVAVTGIDRKSTRLNSSHVAISYAVFCLKKKRQKQRLSVKRYRTRNRYMPQTYGVQITCTFRG